MIGDPKTDRLDLPRLPNALKEAQEIAQLLGTTSRTDVLATRAALFEAASDAVLHVATHGTVGVASDEHDTVSTARLMSGAGLILADGEVSALEIPAGRVGPSLVFLAACDGATSPYIPELAGSLVAGFLGAGSQHVVATLGGISDEDGLKISTMFYRAGGVADPPRALAKVQAALAKTANMDWPKFVVFGPEVCPSVPAHP